MLVRVRLGRLLLAVRLCRLGRLRRLLLPVMLCRLERLRRLLLCVQPGRFLCPLGLRRLIPLLRLLLRLGYLVLPLLLMLLRLGWLVFPLLPLLLRLLGLRSPGGLLGFPGLLGLPRIGLLVAHRASPSCTANSTARSRASPKSTGSVPEVPA